MSDEIKSGTEGCKSTIEHETAGVLRCESGHEPFLPYPDVHGCGGHGWADGDSRTITPARPWRFDVPEVPPHVTALKDVEGYVWVRVAECWQAADDPTTEFDTFHGLVRFVEMTPLVECPDPRAAS